MTAIRKLALTLCLGLPLPGVVEAIVDPVFPALEVGQVESFPE